MKNRLNPFLGTFAVIAMTQAAAHAASATWNGTTDAVWATGTNWSATPVPGTGDLATFNNAGGAVDVINLGTGVTIKDILFNTSSVAAYTIGSGTVGSQTLTLNNSGTITANNTINANQLFNAKLVLGTDATGGSYTITNNDLSNTLTFAGAISGFSTGGTRTLNVKTANQNGVIVLSGAITNGGASNSLALNFSAVSGNVGMTMGNTGNTYSGGTTIGTGVRLQVNAGAGKGLGTGDVTVASNAQVYLNSAGTYANNFGISGNGGSAGGSLGAIRISATGSNIISGNVTLNADSTIGVDSGRAATISGNITGAFNLAKTSTGAGTGSPLTLSGTNSYTGTTTITNGVISFAKKASLYNSDTTKWTPANLSVASGNSLALGVGDLASGYWDAAGVTDFLGASQMGNSTATTGFKTGSLLGFDTTNATAGTFTYNTAIGNVGGDSNVTGVLKLGTGTLVLSGANTYSGTTASDQGVISFANKASLYNSDTTKWTPAKISVASGASLALGVGDSASGYWDAAGVTDFIGASQMGTSTTTTGFKTGSLLGFDTTNATAGTFTYNTAIGNIGSGNTTGVLKAGTGTLVLSGANTYNGATTIVAGTLNLSNQNAVQNSTLTMGGGSLVFDTSVSGNAFTFGGLAATSAGAGYDIALINNAGTPAAIALTVGGNNANTTYAGVLSGTGSSLTKTGTGTLSLYGANNIGDVAVSAGTLFLVDNTNTLGNVSVTGILDLGAGSVNTTTNINGLSGSGNVTTANSGGMIRTLYVGNNDATSDFSGVITKATNRGLILNKVGAGALTLSGAGANVDGGGSGSFATNISAGTLTLNKTGVVALPGATVAVNGGTLKISGTGGNQIADTAVLTLAGGSVEMAAASQTETIASTTLNAGASSVIQSQTASVLTMNVITRNVGGTINFGAGSIATTDTNNSSNGILGGWATVGGTDWAKSVDAAAANTAITAYTGYTNDTWAAANNVTVTTNSTQTSGSTANSLRFDAVGANTLTLAGTNTLTTGGILVTATVGNNLSKITGGTLSGAASKDLVIHQNNTANGLTVESVIADNTATTGLTKSGNGVLTLSSTNTYTGATRVNEGKLVVNGSISSSTNTTVASGATLSGIGTMGAASISGILAPGNDNIGTITAEGDVTWNDNDAWVFELGSAASSLALAGTGNSMQDLLHITGVGSDFLKGTGSSFTFDFSNTGAVGYYKLVDWAGTTNFTSGVNGNFVATNLSPSLTGTFTVDSDGKALYLTVVPEPRAALLGGLGMLALLRRRRA